ncbi:MAG TPA: MFS transporter [Candidatus Limnocylindrales bacterium]
MSPPATSPAAGSVLRPAIVHALLFGSLGAYMPYITLYLGSRGLDLQVIGLLVGWFAVVGLFAAPTWGAIADHAGDVRGPVLVATTLATGAVLLLAVSADVLTLAVSMGLLAAMTAGLAPMVDSRAVRLVGKRERFGQSRAWGSAAFVVVAFAAGAAIERFGPSGMFLVNAPLLLATGIGTWFLFRSAVVDEPRRTGSAGIGRAARAALRGIAPSSIASILARPRFGPLFVALLAIWSSNAALLGFLSIRIVALGGDPTAVAATWSVAALVELPLMMGFPRLAGRIGAERLIVIGGFAFAGRAFASSLAVEPWQIVAASALGGFGYAFVYVGAVTWIAGAVPRSAQATAQGIFTGTTSNVGAIAGSVIGGAIAAALGIPFLFALAGLGYALGGVLAWRALVRRGGAAQPAATPPGDVASA